MSEQNRRDPFEDHINSNNFDVSHLETGIAQKSPLQQEVDAYLSNLVINNHIVSERHLNEEQREITYYLTQGLTQDVMRTLYAEDVQDLSDTELENLVQISVSVAMLAQERLIKAKQLVRIVQATEPIQPKYPVLEDIRQGMIIIFVEIKKFFQRLFQRY